jgi:hypothetical protein
MFMAMTHKTDDATINFRPTSCTGSGFSTTPDPPDHNAHGDDTIPFAKGS